jgi:two-component system CheB/CheR fusion protein
VGIGASAGGLEALEQFFSHLVLPVNMAFVVIMHLDPRHTSMLAGLLQRHAALSVQTIEDGMPLRPGIAYVTPPNRDVSLINGTFQLLEPVKIQGVKLPIDFFLESLAAEKGDMSACVILSGTGSDGTIGMRAIKAAGGLVLVQDCDSARYTGMPGSAIRTGLADYVLLPNQMPAQLVQFFSNGRRLSGLVKSNAGSDDMVRKICVLLRARTGNDFSVYKKSTLQRRIERRMNLHHIDDLSLYINLLRKDSSELDKLFSDILIGVTHFFRDGEAFEVLRDVVLKNYFTAFPEKKSFRVWVPGCSTGEEVYSLAIVLRECLDNLHQDVALQVFGTDLDARSIDRAREGLFTDAIAADVPSQRLQRFFVKEEMHYRVRKELREQIIFSVQNVLKDPPFSKIDLLCCRNLLIYLNAEAQRMLLPLFHFSLNPGGLLFLGTSESTGVFSDLFIPVSKKWKIYQRVDIAPGTQPAMQFPVSQKAVERPVMQPDIERIIADKPSLPLLIHRELLENFTPPCVTVNKKGDIFFIHGRTGKYLEPSEGKPRMNILDMARHGLRLELRNALRNVGKTGEKVICRDVRYKSEETDRYLDLILQPLADSGQPEELIMVIFADVAGPAQLDQQSKESRELLEERDRYLLNLDQELQHARENYQTSLEELETSNEELKSLNEELQSANEELQSTNEELESSREEHQSLNEELMTVNNELQSKVDELVQVQSDLRNLLDSTRIATIFVDSELRIKNFTAAAADIANLIKTDVGRPLEHIATNLEYDDMYASIRQVITSLASAEKEVRSRNGEWYQVNILPYRTTENVIEGAVLTFVSITCQKEAQQHLAALNTELRQSREFVEGVIDTLREAVIVLDADLRIVFANRAFYRMSGLQETETIGREFAEIGGSRLNVPGLAELLRNTLETGAVCEDFAAGGLVLNVRRIEGASADARRVMLGIQPARGAADEAKPEMAP